MNLLILGNTADDKGSQLEQLTRGLLESLGYQRLALNLVGTAGEIDIAGEHVVPAPEKPIVTPLIGECKARQDAVGMPDWLKFLGKMYVKEAGGRRFAGVFIALSGVNGHVQESYRELNRDNLRLVDHSTLTAYLAKSHGLLDAQSVLERLRSVTDRIAWKTAVAYYDGRAYWVIFYDENAYTVLDASGGALPADGLARVRPLVESEIAATAYVNLLDEQNIKRLTRDAVAAVVAATMIGGGSCSLDGVLAFSDALPEGLLEEAFGGLSQNRWFTREADGRLSFSSDLLVDQAELARLYIFLLEGRARLVDNAQVHIPRLGHVFARALGCSWYDEHIDAKMVTEACRAQMDLTLEPNEAVLAENLMRWSPAALLYALHPDEIITRHRQDYPLQIEGMNANDRSRFMRSLHLMLVNDFNRPELSWYFLRVRQFGKLTEARRITLLRENDEIVHNDEVRQTIVLGELGMDGFEGVVIPMLGIEGLPPTASGR